MRLPNLLSTLLAATASLASARDAGATRTAAIYIQPLTSPASPPSLLAEVAIPDDEPEAAAAATTGQDPATTTTAAEVLSYSAPDLPETHDDQDDRSPLLRIGLYDPSTGHWLSSTSVASASNFAKGYAPHFVLSLGGGGGGGDDGGKDEVLGVVCRGVAIDAGVTRDFGPQARVVRTLEGAQPALGKPVVLAEGGRRVEEVEKSFVQKYWWVLAIGAFLQNHNPTISLLVATMASSNGSTDPMAVTKPEHENGAAAYAKGKGKAAATQEPVEDTSMAEDDDDDDEEDVDEVSEPEAADDDNMEEIDLDNVIGRRTRGKVIDFAKAAQENPVEEDEDEEDDDDFVDEDKVDDDKMDED
ncbi:hypothetical protein N658DRAFT_469340 [Parathielavia hyrcaniae]|uniref:Histone chaperone domain-containing protein n=1 Tax=Parathielavia hyrcaniae TaxID=113614 RepID=A0AAN6Q309_9PEZI|nr:hypothetical protein N658DRAFT_469340 [Parathielavia hyrcaniae]